MTEPAALAPWVAILTAVLVVFGAGVTLMGAVGTIRFRSFFERMHAPTLGTSLGTACILLASMIYFSATEQRPVLHEIVIGVFLTITSPVTLMLLARAALYRERMEGGTDVPPITAVSGAGQPRDAAGKPAN